MRVNLHVFYYLCVDRLDLHHYTTSGFLSTTLRIEISQVLLEVALFFRCIWFGFFPLRNRFPVHIALEQLQWSD